MLNKVHLCLWYILNDHNELFIKFYVNTIGTNLESECLFCEVSMKNRRIYKNITDSEILQIEEDPNNDDTLTPTEEASAVPESSTSKEQQEVYISMPDSSSILGI